MSKLEVFAVTLSMLGAMVWADEPAGPTKAPKIVRVSGPFSHANLTVFALHGVDTLPNRPFLTLQEALEQKKVVVNETSNVNQLTVENVSPDVEVFLMTGDIVKGGKQDRAIAFDMILPPKSGAIPIGSFCVEHGRWQQRGAEPAARFDGSMNQVVGKDLKAAIRSHNDQRKVWDEVQKAQTKLSKNAGARVNAAQSPSSLQLALESKDLQAKLADYEKALVQAVEGTDVIGVAFAVNGEVTGAEVYASSALCSRLWPKLLRAAATEALADRDASRPAAPVTAKSVEAFLADAMADSPKELALVANTQNMAGQALNVPAQTKAANQQAGGVQVGNGRKGESVSNVRIMRYEGKKVLCWECQDKRNSGVVIHRTYIPK